MLGIERGISEFLNGVHIDHFLKVVIIPDLDLVDLVRSPEPIKEMKERNSSLNGSKVSNCAKIHYLLRAVGAEHRIAGLTTGHNVRMVAENV